MSESTTPSLEDMRADWVWAQEQFGGVGIISYIEEFHRAIAKIKAEAWEEGHQAGWEEHENPGPFVNDYWDSKLPNPYERNNT